MRPPLANVLTRLLALLFGAALPPFFARLSLPLSGARYRVRRRFVVDAIGLPLGPAASRSPVTLSPTTTLVIHPATPLDAPHVYATIADTTRSDQATNPQTGVPDAHLLEISRRQLQAFCLLE